LSHPRAPRSRLVTNLLIASGLVLSLASFLFLTACPKSPGGDPKEDGDTVHSALPEVVLPAAPVLAAIPEPEAVPPVR